MSADPRIDALVSEGRHSEAAELAVATGDSVRAAELFAAAWNYARAVQVARETGDLVSAFSYALRGDLREETASIRFALAKVPADAVRAAEAAEHRGQVYDAATLFEAAGELSRAAALFERNRDFADAGRCLEALGQWREAGKVYEERLRDSPHDDKTALRLATILVRFGRHEAAARVLQAITQDEAKEPARRLLVVCFTHLGMREAARDRYRALKEADPTLPDTAEEFVETSFGVGNEGSSDNKDWVLGRYHVVRTLGSGGVGRVVLAKDSLYDREVAIKMLRIAEGGRGRDAFARFSREARVALAFDHPNIVRTFEFDAAGPYLVMELMRGGTLDEKLEAGTPLSRAAVRNVLSSIFRALSVVHRHGIVHRDIKPSNVFFDESDTVKLGDFGVAHLTDVGTTLTGAMLGTLAYMAPEQITGTVAPLPSTDLYAVGILAFRMLTGVLPFAGPDYVAQHLNEQPARVGEKNPRLGTDFDSFVAALLEKDAAKRPASADEAQALLDAISRDDVLESATFAPPAQLEVAQPPSPPTASDVRYERGFVSSDGVNAFDRTLGRRVCFVESDVAERARWKSFAAVVHPNLQLVLDIDEERGEVMLEVPRTDADAKLDVSALAAAVAELHGNGLVHGAIGHATIAVSHGRSVLLLPRAHAVGTKDADLVALQLLASTKI